MTQGLNPMTLEEERKKEKEKNKPLLTALSNDHALKWEFQEKNIFVCYIVLQLKSRGVKKKKKEKKKEFHGKAILVCYHVLKLGT